MAKSFTLSPDVAAWIEAESNDTGESQSEIVERVVSAAKELQAGAATRYQREVFDSQTSKRKHVEAAPNPRGPWKRVESPADVAKHAPEVSKKPLESAQDAHALRAVPKPGKKKG